MFAIRSGIAKSEYWKYFGEQLQTKIQGGQVEVTGGSGFYVPQDASILKRTTRRAWRAIRQPAKAASWLRREVASRFQVPRLLSYEEAFDAVMSQAPVSEPVLSPFRVDHGKLARVAKVFASAASVKRHYQAWSGYEASGNILCHYYYQNLLRGFLGDSPIRNILEIGAGNGNFASILYHDWTPVRIVVIDLPETLAVSIPFLSSLFPQARVVMPHEIQRDGFPGDFDFVFLTVDQLELLADDSIDLAINCHSFQEMTHAQIRVYIELVQRVCRDSGFFFSANRIEKIPCGANPFSVEQPDPPNRMAEYPWNVHNQVVIYETCKLIRLIQLDGIDVRLERIRKGQG